MATCILHLQPRLYPNNFSGARGFGLQLSAPELVDEPLSELGEGVIVVGVGLFRSRISVRWCCLQQPQTKSAEEFHYLSIRNTSLPGRLY